MKYSAMELNIYCRALLKAVAATLICTILAACSSSSSNTSISDTENTKSTEAISNMFTLQFQAMVGNMPLTCDDLYPGLGPNQDYSIGVGDLRLYISDLTFYDTNGEKIPTELDQNQFQLTHEAGSVSLIDFTGNDSGYCELGQRGTPRSNTVIKGMIADGTVSSVSFQVGVPQSLMKAVIADTDVESDAPSPLSEMYWSWASGYRHLTMNFTAMNSTHTDMIENSGIHLGSRDCGPLDSSNSATKALSDKEACGLLNTPKVNITQFNPTTDSIVLDIATILNNTQEADFNTENGNFGIQCHSTQAASCASVFPNFGLDITTGLADDASNIVFTKGLL